MGGRFFVAPTALGRVCNLNLPLLQGEARSERGAYPRKCKQPLAQRHIPQREAFDGDVAGLDVDVFFFERQGCRIVLVAQGLQFLGKRRFHLRDLFGNQRFARVGGGDVLSFFLDFARAFDGGLGFGDSRRTERLAPGEGGEQRAADGQAGL